MQFDGFDGCFFENQNDNADNIEQFENSIFTKILQLPSKLAQFSDQVKGDGNWSQKAKELKFLQELKNNKLLYNLIMIKKQLKSIFNECQTTVTLSQFNQIISQQLGESKQNKLKRQDSQLIIQYLNQRPKPPINYQLKSQYSITQNEYSCAIAINSKQTIMIAGCNSQIKVFELQNGQMKQTQLLSDHTSTVVTLYFMKKTNQFISGSKDSKIRIWSIKDNQQYYCQQLLKNGHTHVVNQVIMNNNEDLIISCSYDYSIKFWIKKTEIIEDGKSFVYTLTEININTMHEVLDSITYNRVILKGCLFCRKKIETKQKKQCPILVHKNIEYGQISLLMSFLKSRLWREEEKLLNHIQQLFTSTCIQRKIYCHEMAYQSLMYNKKNETSENKGKPFVMLNYLQLLGTVNCPKLRKCCIKIYFILSQLQIFFKPLQSITLYRGSQHNEDCLQYSYNSQIINLSITAVYSLKRPSSFMIKQCDQILRV